MRPHRSVLVVGAGPSGLVTAITLGRLGIDVLVIDKHRTPSRLARALAISTRSMEIFRAWGLEARIRAGAADVEPLGWVTPSLASGQGRAVPLGYPTTDQAAQISPTRPAWAPQDHLEPLLLDMLASLPTVEVRRGCELVGLEQVDDVVHAAVRHGDAPVTTLVTDYLVAADGAHSSVRRTLGIPMDGPEHLGEFHRVEFRAPLREVVGERRFGLYLISNPEVPATLAPQGPVDRWMLAREWRASGDPRLTDASETHLSELIALAAGAPGLRPRIERTNAFFFSAQLARRYREGRVFLAGDAAHRMTPRGGTGMNTGIQDGFDLGWKLAWVLRGWAEESCLDSYENERRPVGAHNVQRAAQADGAQRDAMDAMPWDLYGRLIHSWIGPQDQPRSTLDLLGDGLTLLAGPAEPHWSRAQLAPAWRAPLSVHQLDAPTTQSLGISPTGAVLLRPDGKTVGRWTEFTGLLTPRAPEPLDGVGAGHH